MKSGHTSSEVFRDECSLASSQLLVDSGKPWHSPGLVADHSNLCLHLHMTFLMCTFECPFLFLEGHQPLDYCPP